MTDGSKNLTDAEAREAARIERAEAARRYPIDERRRVKAVIERDRADRARDDMREAAQLEVSDGNFVHLDDTVMEPTPEWKAKGDVERFTPKAPDGTVRSVSTVRRVRTPIINQLHGRGSITDDQRAALEWYRDQFEAARLDGRYKSNHLSLSGNTGGGSGGLGQSPMPLNDFEATARRNLRAVRSSMTAMYLRFLDAVVIENIPLTRSYIFAKCPPRKAVVRFRQVSEEIVKFCQSERVDLKKSTGDSERG
ncbi:hypothetical protein [Novosphingobium sp. KN65.2]|uniref:hypothetical protein n=1 Tax=Novosphingobium sp. KN65.2 TaxID=1478134 RepID=UPI0005DB1463|nr:hypothetical protein [Novosphingobium sp. KN65.2]CDO34059.1 hypothetical protein SPHV1_100093 [Novosphingobium sp. KN65.2]